MLCGGYALLSPRPPQQIWPDYYCNPGICNRWPSQFLVLLYLRTAQAFSWQHAPGSHPPSLFGAPVSCATVCDPSLLCDSFLVAPAPGAKPFFSRQTASVEQFLFVWRTISLCFLCFRFHNKHSRDRPPQERLCVFLCQFPGFLAREFENALFPTTPADLGPRAEWTPRGTQLVAATRAGLKHGGNALPRH